MKVYRFENVTPERLQAGLAKLQSAGMKTDGNQVSGMGVEASYHLTGQVLTVTVEKAPPFVGGMVESKLREFFS